MLQHGGGVAQHLGGEPQRDRGVPYCCGETGWGTAGGGVSSVLDTLLLRDSSDPKAEECPSGGKILAGFPRDLDALTET